MNEEASHEPPRRASPSDLTFKSGFTLYAKALLIFSLALLLLFSALFSLTEGVILGLFSEVEQQHMREEVRRILYQMEQEEETLRSIAVDWAEWDETLSFARGKNPDFPARNLDPESIRNLRVDFFGIWDAKNTLLELTGPNPVFPSPELAVNVFRELQTEKLFSTAQEGNTASGTILLDRQIATVALHGITNSPRTAPRSGILATGRIWTPARLSELLPPGTGTLSVLHLGRALADPLWRDPIIRLLATGKPVVFSPDDEFMLGLMLLRNPEGTPLCALVFQQERELFRMASRSARIFLLAMTAAGGFVVFLLWFVLDRTILRRLGQMDRAVRSFRTSGKFPAGLDTHTKDELGHLARSIQDLTFSLQESESALRDMSGRLLQMQDEERRRIARELHDSTAQNLSALEMNLALLERNPERSSPSFRDLLAGSREIAESCSREIRTLSYLLHPPLLDEVGLLFAIRWFVEGYETRTGIRVTLALPDEFPRLVPDVETALFRILQECLTNIYRHSGSSTAHISLAVQNDGVRLEVLDQGKGFAQVGKISRPSAGLGLMGMRERVRQQHGTFDLQSNSNGVRIVVTMPMQAVPPSAPESNAIDALDTPSPPSPPSPP